MHVVAKNLQSIRSESRWQDFVAELNTCHFDLLLICETWRGEKDESFITEKGHHIYLSGGANHVPIRTVLLPNALSMGAWSCMSIYFVYLIRCWWMVTLRKDGSRQLFQ